MEQYTKQLDNSHFLTSDGIILLTNHGLLGFVGRSSKGVSLIQPLFVRSWRGTSKACPRFSTILFTESELS